MQYNVLAAYIMRPIGLMFSSGRAETFISTIRKAPSGLNIWNVQSSFLSSQQFNCSSSADEDTKERASARARW